MMAEMTVMQQMMAEMMVMSIVDDGIYLYKIDDGNANSW